mgnify:FL=1
MEQGHQLHRRQELILATEALRRSGEDGQERRADDCLLLRRVVEQRNDSREVLDDFGLQLVS